MKRFFASVALIWVVTLSSVAMSQPPQPSGDPAESRATQFRGVRGPSAERVPGGSLLIGAYGTVFVLVLGFVIRVGLLQSRTQRDIERLERALSKVRS